MAKRIQRGTSYHEAGHVVASHYCRLAGATSRVTLDADDLADYNASTHPANEAAGVHFSGHTLSSIGRGSVDREQLSDELTVLLAGPAAEWVFNGALGSKPRRTRQQLEEFRRHADLLDDHSRALDLLFDADPFDMQAVLNGIPDDARGRKSADELLETYGAPALNAHSARIVLEFEVRWRNALAFVVEKWPHVQAVADALWKKRSLTGDEVEEIILRIEARTKELPPYLADELKGALAKRTEEKG